MMTLQEAITHAREVAEYFTMKSNELYERQYEARWWNSEYKESEATNERNIRI